MAVKEMEMAYNACDGRPAELVRAVLCLDELSKDVRGELMILDSEDHVCRELDCKTLAVEHLLRVEVSSHQCDSELGKQFDGRLTSRDLTTVFVDGSGMRRGMHTATFSWRTAVGIVQGRLSGMTNEGTHREPAFRGCQECGERGVMEGRLCGRLVRAADPALAGAQVTAAYRFAFEPSDKGGEGSLQGTVEGLVVRNCAPSKECVSFSTVGVDVNPRVVGQVTVETRDLNGPTAQTSVVTWGATTGLHMWFSSSIGFAQAVSQVEVTLVHFASPATATAFDGSGAVVSSATMTVGQQVPETLVLNGAGITSVVVDAPNDEVLMTQVCWAR
jgi:hypothetical protein